MSFLISFYDSLSASRMIISGAPVAILGAKFNEDGPRYNG